MTVLTEPEKNWAPVVVLFALTPAGRLTVFEPSKEKLNRLASYKVAEGKTYAYPVIAGKRIFIKDSDSVTLWTIE